MTGRRLLGFVGCSGGGNDSRICGDDNFIGFISRTPPLLRSWYITENDEKYAHLADFITIYAIVCMSPQCTKSPICISSILFHVPPLLRSWYITENDEKYVYNTHLTNSTCITLIKIFLLIASNTVRYC